ncbi:MAG: LacI family DNA-binding transcriptional regulator [Thermotogae bacterium]|nr:LacI family DNA-binding transcriptional regulator [Thermotogota bacterium]
MQKRKRINMKSIAKMSGVSVTTVSRVLGGSSKVNQKTYKRVMGVIKKVGYRPNALARGLSMQKTRTLGVILPDASNTFFSKIGKAIENTVRSHGYSVFLCDTDGIVDNEISAIKSLSERWIDGIILVAPRIDLRMLIQFSQEYEFYPIVADRKVEGIPIPAVWVDNIGGMIQATEYLIKLGHKRIGFVAGPPDVFNAIQRLNGYKEVLKRYGIPYQEKLVFTGRFMIPDGYAAAEYFLSLKEKPTAIIASNDLMAIGILKYLKSNGFEIPKDISLVGFDDIEISEALYPALTTVAQPIYEIGKNAAKMMLDYIETGRLVPNIVLHTHFVVRDSCR